MSIHGKKLFFIINPRAGAGRGEKYWQEAEPRLRKEGYDLSWEYTRSGEIRSQVRRAVLEKGAEVVIALGGDGTLYDVLNGLVEKDSLLRENVVFAAYPVGSACDFGRMIFPDGVPDLIDFLESAEQRPIDIGRCAFADGAVHYFINSFDVGAGADTCAAVNAGEGRRKRFWKNGQIAFKLTALKILMSFRYTQTTIRLPGERFSGEYIIIGCGSGIYIGGGMALFPRAQLDDGMLDLLLVPRMNRLRILSVFSRVYDGSVIYLPGVIYRQTPEAEISCARPLMAELDGELPGQTPVRLSAMPSFLPFLMP